MNSLKKTTLEVVQKLKEIYWDPMEKYLESNPDKIDNFTWFLLRPEELTFYFGEHHLAIEYSGSERGKDLTTNSQQFSVNTFDYTEDEGDFFENITGIKFEGTSGIKFPLPPILEDLVAPTNDAIDKLVELGWNFAAQEAMISMNTCGFEIPKYQCRRVINALLFDVSPNGLITRHIKWLDFIPLKYEIIDEDTSTISVNFSIYEKLFKPDVKYIYPLPADEDFKYQKLPSLNRFIELAANTENSETTITKFLEQKENSFILSMAFLAKGIYPQVICKWQSEEREHIQPDFFILKHNGYADIVEFKLPNLKSKPVVGKSNRETFSAEVNKYISQSRVYEEYFSDPNNRSWFYEKYQFHVLHPRRILVMGRRSMFSSEDWRKLENDFKNLTIMTYDELIDGVMAQFYK